MGRCSGKLAGFPTARGRYSFGPGLGVGLGASRICSSALPFQFGFGCDADQVANAHFIGAQAEAL